MSAAAWQLTEIAVSINWVAFAIFSPLDITAVHNTTCSDRQSTKQTLHLCSLKFSAFGCSQQMQKIVHVPEKHWSMTKCPSWSRQSTRSSEYFNLMKLHLPGMNTSDGRLRALAVRLLGHLLIKVMEDRRKQLWAALVAAGPSFRTRAFYHLITVKMMTCFHVDLGPHLLRQPFIIS